MTTRQEKLLTEKFIRPMVRKMLRLEGTSHQISKPGDYEVGDTVGNTVQGFDFEVISINGDQVIVKNTLTGKRGRYYIGNFYKPTSR